MTPKQVRQVIENYTGIEIMTRSRETLYVEARIIYGKVCNEFLRNAYSLEEIAEGIGRDHATIWHYCNVAFHKRVQKKEFKKLFQEIYILVEQIEVKDRARRKKQLDIETELQRDATEFSKKYAELLREHEATVQSLKQEIVDMKVNLGDPVIGEIASLAPDQLRMFKDRAGVMIKSVKSIRTYENTHKREFNPAEEALKLKTV